MDSPEARLEAQYGVEARNIFNQLLAARRSDDRFKMGVLIRRMWDVPDLLIMVVAALTTRVVELSDLSGHARLAQPEDLNISADDLKPTTWQVGINDQIEAADAEGDYALYAKLSTDAWLRSLVEDMVNHHRETGHYPDCLSILRSALLAEHSTLAACCAEMLHRLAMIEIEGR